jgi:enoyl-CoA hydratase/carnithine racemase
MHSDDFSPALCSGGQVLARRQGPLGLITLNRAAALNALSLGMVRDLTTVLLQWREDPAVKAVLVQGAGREGKPPAFCAGGDIRFFHQAALAGDPRLEDFFTEEYALNHLIHHYPKPYIALMDGVCMGGGMGISQGASLRVVTELSKLAMPETHIGLFPDVGGGWFLARCPGHVGEYLALSGEVLGAADAIAFGLADVQLPSAVLPRWWRRWGWLVHHRRQLEAAVRAGPWRRRRPAGGAAGQIDLHFSRATLGEISPRWRRRQRLGATHAGRAAQALAADDGRGPGAGAPRPPHEPGGRSAHGARPGAPLLPPAPGHGQRDGGGHPRAGGRQGPPAALEPGPGGGCDAGPGGSLLRQPWPAVVHPLRALD